MNEYYTAFLNPGGLVGGGLIKSYWMRRCPEGWGLLQKLRCEKDYFVEWSNIESRHHMCVKKHSPLMWNNVSDLHMTKMKCSKRSNERDKMDNSTELFPILVQRNQNVKRGEVHWGHFILHCIGHFMSILCMNVNKLYHQTHACMFMRVSMMYGGNVFINQWPQWVPTTFSS